jgi:hypothetical protein
MMYYSSSLSYAGCYHRIVAQNQLLFIFSKIYFFIPIVFFPLFESAPLRFGFNGVTSFRQFDDEPTVGIGSAAIGERFRACFINFVKCDRTNPNLKFSAPCVTTNIFVSNRFRQVECWRNNKFRNQSVREPLSLAKQTSDLSPHLPVGGKQVYVPAQLAAKTNAAARSAERNDESLNRKMSIDNFYKFGCWRSSSFRTADIFWFA